VKPSSASRHQATPADPLQPRDAVEVLEVGREQLGFDLGGDGSHEQQSRCAVIANPG
jgi:hypothetical protein